MIKKLLILIAVFVFVSCDNDIDDIVQRYQIKPKSQALVGFWQLKGIYPPGLTQPNANIEISFNGYLGIGRDEILFLDNDYLRFLNRSSNNGDTIYQFNSKNKFYWYNESTFIKALHQSQYNSDNFQNIQEHQFPYKFGHTKDTLIIQSNGNILYLLKKIDIEYEEYDVN